MSKSDFEKALEKQMKQQKQLAEKQRRDAEKREREAARMEQKATLQRRASSVVNGQPLIEGFRIMDKTAEEILSCLLKCEHKEGNRISFSDEIFPQYAQMSISLELEKLLQYGMIGGLFSFDNGGLLNLLPPALSYFEDKENALSKQKERQEKQFSSITNYGNLVFGNVSDSTFSVDNSIHEIERMIDEYGGDDKDELKGILIEIQELLENINTARSIPKQKKLFQKITNHVAKHGWFYGAVVQLLGTEVFKMIGM